MKVKSTPWPFRPETRQEAPAQGRPLTPVALAGLVLALATGFLPLGAQAQFKWIARDGVVHYSDLPPPPGTRLLPQAGSASTAGAASPTAAAAPPVDRGRAAASPLPFELATALRQAPVTLYSTVGCSPCDEGRALLRARGIPVSERRIESEADLRALQAMDVPSAGFPVLVIGKERAIGFESGQWQRMLDAAGYPVQSVLPRDWVHEPARSLTPTSPTASAGAGAGTSVEASSTPAERPAGAAGAGQAAGANSRSVPGQGAPARVRF
ncbi:MAG: DUF4124 domain-containing protein [Burkholderiaceae bacterium]